ncbi:MAG: antitoxin YefM [Bacteroidota bacterium]|nr:antitoxin YefM [Bacteroidota bacterium]
MRTITIAEFQSNIPYYLNLVEQGTDIVLKESRKKAVIIPYKEYESLKETEYLLSNPVNAEYIKESIDQLNKSKVFEKELLEI